MFLLLFLYAIIAFWGSIKQQVYGFIFGNAFVIGLVISFFIESISSWKYYQKQNITHTSLWRWKEVLGILLLSLFVVFFWVGLKKLCTALNPLKNIHYAKLILLVILLYIFGYEYFTTF